MNVLIHGRNKNEIKTLISQMRFDLVEKNPDFVISYGGDGTLMQAEHIFPGVPKIILKNVAMAKNSFIAKKASLLPNKEILRRFQEGQYKIDEYWKLEAQTKNKILIALNDVIVHNQDPRHAIRYQVWVNGKPIEIGHEIIGDGVVLATSFGATGYYRSITHSSFEVGLGLAFNNSTEQYDHVVLKEESVIKIKIVRGPAQVYADNQEEYILLNDKEEVVVKKSQKSAKIVVVD